MVDTRLELLNQQMADLETTIAELQEIKKLAKERMAKPAP